MRAISKTVTTHYIPLEVHKSSLVYDKVFADARKDKKEKMNRCFRCNWPFHISGSGEEVSVVAFKGIGNRLVCNDCADWILGKGDESDA